jgi:hypothetical protein
MTATLDDGSTVAHTVEHATGSTAAPMTDDQLRDKVLRLTGHLDDPARLWDTAWRLDEIGSAAELFAAAR